MGRGASAEGKQVAGCQETNPWVLQPGNKGAEHLLSVPCLVRQFPVSLAHQLSADPALFKALKPRSPSP